MSNKGATTAERIAPDVGELTPREKRIVQETLKQSGDVGEAIKEVHGTNTGNLKTKKGRTAVGLDILNRSHVSAYMEKILNKAGLSDEYVAETLKKIIEAGTSKRALSDAKASEALKAVKEVNKVKDRYPAQRIEAKTANLSMELKAKDSEDLKKQLSEIQGQTQQFLEQSGQASD